MSLASFDLMNYPEKLAVESVNQTNDILIHLVTSGNYSVLKEKKGIGPKSKLTTKGVNIQTV